MSSLGKCYSYQREATDSGEAVGVAFGDVEEKKKMEGVWREEIKQEKEKILEI